MKTKDWDGQLMEPLRVYGLWGTHGGGIDGDGPRVGGRVDLLPARGLASPPKRERMLDRDGPG